MPDHKSCHTTSILLALGLALVGCAGSTDDANDDDRLSIRESSVEDSFRGAKGDHQSVLERELSIQEIGGLIDRGDYEQADEVIRSMLSGEPNSASIVFTAARSAHDQGRLDEAIEHLRLIPPEHPDAGFPAMGQAADWLLEAERLAEAEAAFEAMLRQFGDVVPVHRKLANLLNSQGRRVASARHVKAAERVAARKRLLDEAWQLALNVGLDRETRTADMQSLAEILDQLGRHWEAVSWRMALTHESGILEQAMPGLLRRRQTLTDSSSGVTPGEILCGIDKADWPLPDESFLSTESAAGLAKSLSGNFLVLPQNPWEDVMHRGAFMDRK